MDGVEADIERNEEHGEATLAMATALNPFIGYDRASAIVRDATSSGRSLREVARAHGVEESVLDEALDLRKIARGNTGVDATSAQPPAGGEVLVVARAAPATAPAPADARERAQ